MEGVSAENNAICLELTSENLSRALKTAQNARALKIKLTNKHFPCLTVSIELVSRRGAILKLPRRSCTGWLLNGNWFSGTCFPLDSVSPPT